MALQIPGGSPTSIQPFKNIDTIKDARLDPASIIHDPALVDPYEEKWLDESDRTLVVVSPYRSREHLLDLHILHTNQQLLAKALTSLQPIRPDYATCSYPSAFNWPTVISALHSLTEEADYAWPTQHFYIVVFRSRIPPTTNRIHLAELDRISHAEATKSGGLLKYWFGVPDEEGRNLATCQQAFLDYRDASS